MGDLWRAQGAAGRAQAQRCYATALRLDQSYAPAWRGLGDLLREEGDHAQAVACYQVKFGLVGIRSGRSTELKMHKTTCKGIRVCASALTRPYSDSDTFVTTTWGEAANDDQI